MKIKKAFRKIRRYSGSNALRKKLGLTGKRIKKSLFGGVTSAGSYAYARGEYYGPTGSIVGRY